MDLRLLIVFGGAFATLWAMANWRPAVQVVMVLLVLEGAIRKWLFLGAQDLVYLGKDVLLIGAYLGFLRQRAQLRNRPPPLPALYSLLAIGAVFGLFEISNPQLPNILVGVFGFKAYFLYVPLLFVIPAAFDSDQDLAIFLRRYILLSIPVGALAVAQFLSPSSSVLNTYARAVEGPGTGYATTFGSSEFVRVTSTFSYITGYGSYLIAMTFLVLAYLAALRWRLRRGLLAYGSLGITLLGMLMTGSRGPVLIVALLFPIYWWLAVIRGAEGASTFGRLLLGMSLLGILIGSAGADALTAFAGRAGGSGNEMLSRSLDSFTSPFEVLPEAGLIGFGIGATHQSAPALTQGILPYSWLHGIELESEGGRIMIELGPIGFFLVYLVRLFLIGIALRQSLVLRTTFHRALATACLLFLVGELPGNVVFDVTCDMYYWFFAGLLMLVVRLDRQAVRRASRAIAATSPPAPLRTAWSPAHAPAGLGAHRSQ
jgi:hypothetical protein